MEVQPKEIPEADEKILRRQVEEYQRWFRTLDRQIRLLERERQKLSAVVNHTDAGFLLVDSSLRILWANKIFSQRFGPAASTGAPVGMSCNQVLCHRDEVCESCPGRRPFGSGVVAHHEMRLEIDDEVHYLYTTAMPVKSPDGKIDECIIMVQDVSDLQILRQSQEALTVSEERFRSIFENVGAGMVTNSPDGSFHQVNPAFCQMLGYSEEELLSMKIDDITHPEDREMTHNLFQEVISGQRRLIEVEKRYVRKDDQTVWGHTTAVWFKDSSSGSGNMVALVQDITKRKRAEERLRESRRAYEALLNSIDGIVWEADARNVEFSFVSKQAERMLGYPAKYWIEDPTFWAEHIHPADRDHAVSFCARATAEKRDHVFEYRMIAADGRVVWLRDTVTVVVENDEPVMLRGIMMDITDRKEAEAALQESEDQLRQSQKMEAVGRLAGGIAHDFNNLLTAITGYADFLLKRLEEDDPLRREAAEITKAAQRAAALTGQLLAFSRRQVLQPKVLDLNAVVADMEEMLRRVIGEDVELETKLGSDLWTVRADPGQLQQVLVNLAVNARDAMPDGGKLMIETANMQLDEDHARKYFDAQPGPCVVLSVSDTGCGMGEDVRSNIFEPFFTTKERGKGTGLGLSTVYGIIKQTGGHIGVDSERGMGSTFKICLPREVGPVGPTVESELDPDEQRGGSETVLLVEDDSAVRTLAREILEMYGYHVLEATDGVEALSVSEDYSAPIHLLLTDVVMPRMGGLDLTTKLEPIRPGMKVLFMSGYIDGPITQQGVFEAGASFLQKPFTPEGMARKVREVIDASLEG